MFETAEDDDMRAFPLRSLLAQDVHEDSSSCFEAKDLSRQISQYYDAKSDAKELELERWESVNGIQTLFDEHDEVRKVFRESVGQILQAVRLTPKQIGVPIPESIVVANTHLWVHDL